MVLKSSQEIEKMRRAGRVVREVLELVRSHVKPGATTLDLEKVAEARIKELGARPAFKGYHGYPCVLCTSINSEVVHGIPSKKRVLKEGDIVSVDCGAVIDGYFGDAAITVPVGEKIAPDSERLLRVTEASLQAGIAAVKPGANPAVALPAAPVTATLFRSAAPASAPNSHFWAKPEAGINASIAATMVIFIIFSPLLQIASN